MRVSDDVSNTWAAFRSVVGFSWCVLVVGDDAMEVWAAFRFEMVC